MAPDAPAASATAGPARFHWLRLRATAHPTEDAERVADAIRFVLGDADNLDITATPLPAQHGGDVTWFEAELSRNRAIRDAAARLLTGPDAPAGIRHDWPQRLDDDGVLYLRFGKQAAATGRLVAQSGDDAIQVRIRIQAHPATADNIRAAWTNLLGEPT